SERGIKRGFPSREPHTRSVRARGLLPRPEGSELRLSQDPPPIDDNSPGLIGELDFPQGVCVSGFFQLLTSDISISPDFSSQLQMTVERVPDVENCMEYKRQLAKTTFDQRFINK
ncbi:hypothetical protein KI387_030807, partial [Taxus chinensis]